MSAYIRTLLSGRRALLQRLWPERFTAEIAPTRDLVVIGDIHGCADLLEQLLERIAHDAGTAQELVFVGDYIDRGEDSAKVLARLQALQAGDWHGEVICLRGNHEAMLLDYLDDPEAHGAQWLANGGMHTFASFGLAPPAPTATPGALYAASARLSAALGPEIEAWLRALPYSHLNGNIFIAHAGAAPDCPIDRQVETDLLWGHPEFLTRPRRDDIWVAHGHTICETATATHGRISVDTGAYATNRLTAAYLSTKTCRFLST